MTFDPFVAHRSLLFTVAYEMLGSTADAEDVVQETGVVEVRYDERLVSVEDLIGAIGEAGYRAVEV